MATEPMANEASPSKTGVKVTPALVVRHTPPAAAATNQRLLSVGSTARSTTRPEVSAGPMLRSSRPLQASAVRPLGGAGDAAVFGAGVAFGDGDGDGDGEAATSGPRVGLVGGSTS